MNTETCDAITSNHTTGVFFKMKIILFLQPRPLERDIEFWLIHIIGNLNDFDILISVCSGGFCFFFSLQTQKNAALWNFLHAYLIFEPNAFSPKILKTLRNGKNFAISRKWTMHNALSLNSKALAPNVSLILTKL